MNSNSNSNDLTILPTPGQLAERFRNLAEDYIELASDLVRCLDSSPDYRKKLIGAGIANDIIDRFARLGRGLLHRELAFTTSHGGMKLIGCDLSIQTEALADGVEVLDPDETTIRRIPIHDLTAAQAALVFYRKSIRSIAQQRTKLREDKAKLRVEPLNGERVFKDGVQFMGVRIPRSVILRWVEEMG